MHKYDVTILKFTFSKLHGTVTVCCRKEDEDRRCSSNSFNLIINTGRMAKEHTAYHNIERTKAKRELRV